MNGFLLLFDQAVETIPVHVWNKMLDAPHHEALPSLRKIESVPLKRPEMILGMTLPWVEPHTPIVYDAMNFHPPVLAELMTVEEHRRPLHNREVVSVPLSE